MIIKKTLFLLLLITSLSSQASFYVCPLDLGDGELIDFQAHVRYEPNETKGSIVLPNSEKMELPLLGFEEVANDKILFTFGFFMGTLSFELQKASQFSAAVSEMSEIEVTGYTNVTGEENKFSVTCKSW